ncbi:MAG TPA: GNAT family N-acetyltransferase [Vicinamibacterales bacterium]
MDVRAAEVRDVDHLARIWYDGWQDAHAGILPVELRRFRTQESVRDRLTQARPHVRVVGPVGAPVGFCITRRDELYQLYVSAESRGSGVAAALIADAEARLAEAGVATAWLACAIGNDRAARFYEKHGWSRVGTVVNHAETSEGSFPLEVWRYEKSFERPAMSGCIRHGRWGRCPAFIGPTAFISTTRRTHHLSLRRVRPAVVARARLGLRRAHRIRRAPHPLRYG